MGFYLLRIGVNVNESNTLKAFNKIINSLKDNNLWFLTLKLGNKKINSEKEIYNTLMKKKFCNLKSMNNDSELRVQFFDNELRFFIYYDEDYRASINTKIVQKAKNFYSELYNKTNGLCHFLDWIGLENNAYDLPQLRPPLKLSCFHWGYAINLFTKDNINIKFMKSEEAYTLLRNEKLPKELSHVERIIEDDYIIFKWVNDDTDVTSWKNIAHAQQKWLKKIFNPPILYGFNEFGDEEMLPIGLKKNKHTTFYSEDTLTAYQTFVVKDNQVEDTHLLHKFSNWKEEEKLPDGSKIQNLVIIVPSRENAVSIKETVFELGIDEIYYVNSDGNFMNPFPDGNWIQE